MKMYWLVEVELHAFLTSALDGGEWPASRPDRFTPTEGVIGTHWIGGSGLTTPILIHIIPKLNII
jgi:hypothetical protein